MEFIDEFRQLTRIKWNALAVLKQATNKIHFRITYSYSSDDDDDDDDNNNNNNNNNRKCVRICLKRGSVQSKLHVGSTFDNDIKELDPRKAYKYLGIEEI